MHPGSHPCPRCGVQTTRESFCTYCLASGRREEAIERQVGWERNRALAALREAEQRLEMAGRSDLAAEVRAVRAKLG
jgi:hypothetical protein